MSDIDFEELDKAVNSIMGQNEDVQPEGVIVPGNTQAVSADTATAAPGVSATVSPAIRRPMGRFMDIVPASGVRKPDVKPAPSAVASRESVTLEPVSMPESQPAVSLEPVVNAAPAEDTAVPEAPDMMHMSEAPAPDVTPEHSTPDEPPVSPMQSPFLSDIAVDKRPLGVVDDSSVTGDTQETIDTLTPPLSSATTDPWGAELPQEDIPDAATIIVPPEMGAEVLALESNEVAALQTEHSVPADPVPEQPLAAPSEQPSRDVTSVNASSDTSSDASPRGDILPQYTSSTPESPEPSAIFDVAVDAPQPLMHQSSKKSGWFILVWILLLIAVGIAGGVAAWYFLVK